MPTLDGYALRRVLIWRIQDSRVVHDRLIPSGRIGYRGDETAGGRVIDVAGEIRDDPDYVLRIEELRARQDDVAMYLDLEDGTPPINVKLGDLDVSWDVEDGLDRPSYSATFYETS